MTRTSAHPRVATAAALCVGLLVAVQSRINASLARSLLDGDGGTTAAGIHAALISFATGLALLAVGLCTLAPLRRGMRGVAQSLRAHRLRPWQLLGGAGGAWLVATQGLTVPTLGVALFVVAVVAGQTAASLGVDAAGLGPLGKLRVSGNRVLAALVALSAVAVTAIPRIETGSGSLPLLLALLAVTAGAGIAVQQALNARVAVAAKYAPSAAVVNFVVGTAVLAAVLLLGTVLADWRTGPLPSQPLLYFGGPIGVAFIAIAAWAVPKVGVLNFALASIAGQLAGGALLDMLFPQPGVTVGPALLLGLALTGIAVMIGNRRG